MPGERMPYPAARDVLDAREEQFELRMDTAFPGRVQSYDADLQVADIVPLVRKQVPQPDGSHVMEDLPVLPCTPVCFPRMGGWFLSFPVAPGDTGLVIVCSGAIGHWRVGSGDITDPGDLRRQHIAHSIFLPMGLVPRARKLTQTGAAGMTTPTSTEPARPSGVVLGSDAASGSRILLRADGTVEILAGGGVAIRSSVSTTVDLQGGTQPFVNGTLYADALGVFLAALGVFVTGVGTIITALGVFCAAVAAHPLLTAVLATPGSTLATAMTAFGGVVSTFAGAITNFASARTAYLSTRIRGS